MAASRASAGGSRIRSIVRSRARILSAFFIFIALTLVIRLYFVQVVNSDKFVRDAMAQYAQRAPDAEDRGTVFFSRKSGERVAAAVMQSGWRLAISPKELQNAEAVFEALNAAVPLDRERFFASAVKTTDPYEEVAFKLPDDAAGTVRALMLPGVILVQDQWRYYPGGELAAHAVGFVGFKGDTKVGVYGLERQWQDTLSRARASHYVNPFAEIFTNLGELMSADISGEQGDVITTIEPNAQRQLEDTLDQVRDRYIPKHAGGIIMDPKTGEIIALALRPSFDPNTYNTEKDGAVFSNALIENIYEMGSIMKPLTMAAGIDAGAITPTTTYEDRGSIMKSGKKVSNFDGKARGVVSMQEVLSQSLNTGASFVVDSMGKNVFADYMHKYALGEKSGIDLPSEAAGSLLSIENGSDVDYASASFGQGIAVSPVEMVRALSALANDGALPNPHITSAIRHRSGVVKGMLEKEERQVLKPETAETVTRMLVKVYDDALLEGVLKQERYSIAAKTGTAQIAMPGGGGYYEGRYLHSFFGYFPAHDAKFIVFLYALEPQREKYASHTLAEPFLEIAKFLINYYEIPPDR